MLLGIQGYSNFGFGVTPKFWDFGGPIIKIYLEIAKTLNFDIAANICFGKGCIEKLVKKTYLYNVINTETLDGYAINMNEQRNWLSVLLNIECT